MSTPSSFRTVALLDGRYPDRPFIEAIVYRDYPSSQLEFVESQWADAREHAAAAGLAAGLAPLEHSHWDWRGKTDRVEEGRIMLIGVECAGDVQGMMAIPRIPPPGKLSTDPVVYVDYVESAPWNIRGTAAVPRFFGVGTVLIAEAVILSLEMGLNGRVGLHSLPQAEAFYNRVGMTRMGPDADYYDLSYFEFAAQQAREWLDSIGVNP